MPTIRKFDLNIENILEGWEICHAVREVIANALDEQALTNTRDVEITKGRDGAWHVQDYGRGLKYTESVPYEKKRRHQTRTRKGGRRPIVRGPKDQRDV